MEISPWLVYLVLKLGTVHVFLIMMGFAGLFLGTILLCVMTLDFLENGHRVCSECEKNNLAGTWWQTLWPFIAAPIFSLIIICIGLLTPTTKDALLIYGIPQVIKGQSKAIQELNGTPLKVAKLVNQYLDEAISAGKEDKGREKEND